MARVIDRQVSVGFGKESTRGTAVAATAWYPKLSLSFADKVDRVTQESTFGVLDKNSGRYTVKQRGEGDLEGAVYKNLFGHILSNFFGQTPTTTTVETTAKQHVWTLAQINTHLTHTIARGGTANSRSIRTLFAIDGALQSPLRHSAPAD